ncbi:hypothetical protein J6590_017597 [Homalodisca vitripennis]|nr:hypothetical protein J6590_017597 [Homalodisca vitripennis]
MIFAAAPSTERPVRVLSCFASLRHSLFLHSGPKFSTDDKSSSFFRSVGQGIALLCPAQGFPVPMFRIIFTTEPVGVKAPTFSSETSISSLKRQAEPIGSTPPRLPPKSKLDAVSGVTKQSVVLPCDAQANPVPIFRTLRQGCARVVPRWLVILYLAIEPTNNIKPRYSGIQIEGSIVQRVRSNRSTVILCDVSAFPIPIFSINLSEPVSNIVPRVSKERFEGNVLMSGTTATLLCPGQGFPAPFFKWYKFIDGTTRKQAVQMDDRVKQVSGTLIIREAKVEDSGKYLCVVNNSVGGESVETVLTVTAPLSATVEPTTQTVDFGRPAVLTCNYEGNPVKTISWLKDGKTVAGHEEPVLRIDSVRKEDKGMYQCVIRNEQESAQASAELKLGGRFEPPQIKHAFNEETMQPGPSVFLKCIATGNPSPEITWELDSKKLSNTERLQVGQYVTVNGDVVSHLNISSVHTNDGGLYKCVATSKVGSAEHAAKLNVYGLPFVRPMEKKAIVAGETLVVTCPVAGYPIESIVWERDQRQLPINRKQKVFPNGTLIIENVERLSDQATYTCVARNAQGYSVRGTLEVQVMVPPVIAPFAFERSPMNAGGFAMLHCTVPHGDLPLNINWSYPNSVSRPLVTVTQVAERVVMLTIESLSARHAGNYTCHASNRGGSAVFTAALDVNVPPSISPFTFGALPMNAGGFALVQCAVTTGDLPLNITWKYPGDHQVTSVRDSQRPKVTVTRMADRAVMLSIDVLTADHAGNYTCVATNAASTTSYTAELHINVPPKILPFTFGDRPLNFGQLVTVPCAVVEGDAPITLQWHFNGQTIASRHRITVVQLGDRNVILSIASVDEKHVGNYSCIARNLAGYHEITDTLYVNVLPHISPFGFEGKANSGDSVQLTCYVAKGDSPLSISWSFRDQPLSSHLGISTTKIGDRTSLLTISSVMAGHAGNYTCSATNRAGSANHSATLFVNGSLQSFVV